MEANGNWDKHDRALILDLVDSNRQLAAAVGVLTERIKPYAEYRKELDALSARMSSLEIWRARVDATAGAAKFGYEKLLAFAGFLFGLAALWRSF